jgi:hypothetical protein
MNFAFPWDLIKKAFLYINEMVENVYGLDVVCILPSRSLFLIAHNTNPEIGHMGSVHVCVMRCAGACSCDRPSFAPAALSPLQTPVRQAAIEQHIECHMSGPSSPHILYVACCLLAACLRLQIYPVPFVEVILVLSSSSGGSVREQRRWPSGSCSMVHPVYGHRLLRSSSSSYSGDMKHNEEDGAIASQRARLHAGRAGGRTIA